jgi:ATP-dependent exoDNAse (exonuclease V) beta subunit
VTELCLYLDPLLEQRRESLHLQPAIGRLPSLQVDALLEEQRLESHFGILTHQLLVRWAVDPNAPPPQPDWQRVPEKLRPSLLAGALTLCRNFFDSELGQLSMRAGRSEWELPFLYLHEDSHGPLFVSGQIDLVFELQDRMYLVDFKTDRSYKTGEHESQLGLYHLALRELTEKEICPCLFLLRSGEIIQSDLDPRELITRVRPLL